MRAGPARNPRKRVAFPISNGMKRIKVSKKELIAELIEKVINETDEEVVLVIPKGASIGESVSNFHLLDREARAANKKVIVESVDESILALAKASQIEAHHPLLDSQPVSGLSDIVPSNRISKKSAVLEVATAEEEVVHDAVREGSIKVRQPLLEDNPHRLRLRFNLKAILWLVLLSGIVWGGVYAIDSFWSRATVDITLNKTPWAYDHVFVADASVSRADQEKNILPGELFTLQKNLTQLFKASGKSSISSKASGKIIIYNAYSSKPQVLVATTRFQAPDGKIFRISNQAVVPAATIRSGKITPSKIEADIVADKPGPEYNIGPIPKLVIPGFKGSPRYEGFYGQTLKPTKGGFVGEKAIPTADDITTAKNKTTAILKAGLESGFLSAYPAGFKIPEGASQVSFTKLKVNTDTDEEGKFSVFGEASMMAMGFKEGDLKTLVLNLAGKDNPNLVFKELNLAYKDIGPDFANKKLIFNLSASGTLWPDFKDKDFALSILGKQVPEARSMVASLKGLSTAKISIWPSWVGTIPADINRVRIVVH